MKEKYREEILEKSKTIICNDRNDQYGEPEDNFELIAKYWSIYLGFEGITASDVAIMMALFKIARMSGKNYKEDTYIDSIGYLACGAEIEHNKGE